MPSDPDLLSGLTEGQRLGLGENIGHQYGVVPADIKVRHQGVAAALLKGALKWARTNGITLVEAYPVDRATKSGDDAMWFGAKSMYDDAGFVEVARRKPARPVVRKRLRARGSPKRQQSVSQ